MRKINRVPPGVGISLFNSRTGTFEPITVLGLWSTRGENYYNKWDIIQKGTRLSCQPRMTVISCFIYKVIRGLLSKDHLCK